jgi:hypothetical protein
MVRASPYLPECLTAEVVLLGLGTGARAFLPAVGQQRQPSAL